MQRINGRYGHGKSRSFIQRRDKTFIKLLEVVKQNGGACLSKEYEFTKQKLDFKCRESARAVSSYQFRHKICIQKLQD
mgnify:CR=1 FL=1